ncbi:MAG: hypothetical protein UU80_C0002G0023 [candidate division WWE3 bacterium GW2011_GWA1_41_8]|uniref:Uncharacterized protein n=2 Tax=Katanobacteria TaxID=422282 RepID=A0A0G0ZL63_UNCKA|nr:MAG: hypothetical protein UU72_C0004G0028 [candidate division WWE3 bacterium GW2011_GWB1_41_6]KKS22791.1 MAG: hypothetical protein UU80_C0002G0023 [candidate division WWE3 bacterium GW2011_GWA1_41_8]
MAHNKDTEEMKKRRKEREREMGAEPDMGGMEDVEIDVEEGELGGETAGMTDEERERRARMRKESGTPEEDTGGYLDPDGFWIPTKEDDM